MSETAGTRHSSPVTRHLANPWYREPWPWILMAGPAAVVVAGIFTAWLAVTSSDGLVADDYYRRGLAINQELRRDEIAVERGIAISLETRDGLLRARIVMRGDPPAVLFVRLVHPTRANQDRRLRLVPTSPGVYEAPLEDAAGVRWHVVLEDPRGEWRVVKEEL
jgi:uncharacterized protein